MDPVSHKRERFQTLSARRLDQTQHLLRLLGNLSGHAYEWHPDEVKALFAGVRQAVDAAELRFRRAQRRADELSEGQQVAAH